MKSAGKARSNGLYRHIRTSKEIIRNLLNDYHKNKNGYCGGFRPHTVPVFLMQSRGDYSAAGTEKEICVAPVMASADSIVMGDVSTLRVAKEPS